jgi:flagellar biosynthesis/type III secretory pathway protein FliH
MTLVRSLHVPQADVRTYIATTAPMLLEKPDPLEVQAEEIAGLRIAIERAARTAEVKESEARAAGFAEGAAAAEQDFRARTAALVDAAGKATAIFAAQLARSEEMAALIANAALSRLFDDPDDQAERVVSAIRRQVRELRRDTVLAIHVSADDFPTEESQGSAACAVGGFVLVADADLPAGGCVIKLKLGELDLGLDTQWSTLSEMLLTSAGVANP